MLTKIEKSYIAGLFDGEGYVGIAVKQVKNMAPNHWLEATITGTHKPTIEWLHSKIGGRLEYDPRSYPRRASWKVRILGRHVVNFLKDILPYIKIKFKEALIAISFYENMITPLPRKDLRVRNKEITRRETCRKSTLHVR